jgi:hypothetical protein
LADIPQKHQAIGFLACKIEMPASQEAMNITKNLGMLVLAIYLILTGLIGLFGFSLGGLGIIMPILALVAGILILIGK